MRYNRASYNRTLRVEVPRDLELPDARRTGRLARDLPALPPLATVLRLGVGRGPLAAVSGGRQMSLSMSRDIVYVNKLTVRK